MGIIAGLGRGMPSPRPPSRPAGGRGGRSPAPGPAGPPGALGGAGRRPMPCAAPKGLLPGRGAPGRGPEGRGVAPPGPRPGCCGRGVALGRGAGCSARAAGAAGVSGASGAGAAGFGPGLGPGRGDGAACRLGGRRSRRSRPAPSRAGVGGAASAGSAGAGAAGAGGALGAGAFLAGAFAGAAEPAPSSAPYLSMNFFLTGGSTVDDADLTNSPISLSLARTTLLSTPSSLASSWTRTLDTLLLLVRAGMTQTANCVARSSRSTHRVLMSCCSCFCRSCGGRPAPGARAAARRRGSPGRAAPGRTHGVARHGRDSPGCGAGRHLARWLAPLDPARPEGPRRDPARPLATGLAWLLFSRHPTQVRTGVEDMSPSWVSVRGQAGTISRRPV